MCLPVLTSEGEDIRRFMLDGEVLLGERALLEAVLPHLEGFLAYKPPRCGDRYVHESGRLFTSRCTFDSFVQLVFVPKETT
jgi:hypothetical protein